jgi:hypothetical protein
VGTSGEYGAGIVSGWLEEVVAKIWRIFSGLIIVIWFSRERSSPSLGRSTDHLVSAFGFPLSVLGQ